MNISSKETILGIFDSGLGGLSVWSEIVRLVPNQSTIYYADTANCPYGGKSSDEIYELTSKGVDWLLKNKANVIVIACNTATSAAISRLREKYTSIPIIGIEPAIKPAAQMSSTGIVGVLATKYTLQSDKYNLTKKTYADNTKVIEIAGEGLVELVEEGITEGEIVESLLLKYVKPMTLKGVDTIVLGCTHYPFLIDSIKKIAGKDVTVINPAPSVAKRVFERMKEANIPKGKLGEYRFHSTISRAHSLKVRKRALEILNNL